MQEVDGADNGRKAVREQISNGVDWIKVYSTVSYASCRRRADDIPTFTLDELRAIVDESHRERRKVASHAAASTACTTPSRQASTQSSTANTSPTPI